uniref:Uncharacterized protein n=1 Tax=Neogobius melanostomus TaxID=47308 RepID=A0A8C6UYN5_9GOBI
MAYVLLFLSRYCGIKFALYWLVRCLYTLQLRLEQQPGGRSMTLCGLVSAQDPPRTAGGEHESLSISGNSKCFTVAEREITRKQIKSINKTST